MCQRAICPTCRKVTYTGCGRHVEQVLAGVPAPRRCTCAPARGGRARERAPEPAALPDPGSSRHTGAPAHRSRGGLRDRLVRWLKGSA
ncbi:hypothetical protein Sfr7A_27105 [Streptomyces xinghaiensis]|uniref:Uncharacterized protein n=1 Tax=Streptomyces xinghaiensis TaxID=1038928 RepID=A0A3R7IXK6_9ACTN|nr:hypothetical protein Sfr7A_27105 [Streptomyces xinghaiensis]RKM91255.1 hypothetical protein SFRA_029560 [Streptomyces xinghaiensis]RNC69748.1 hypothetical protein DC095_028645 [Streptomyces xinghaiensis]